MAERDGVLMNKYQMVNKIKKEKQVLVEREIQILNEMNKLYKLLDATSDKLFHLMCSINKINTGKHIG